MSLYVNINKRKEAGTSRSKSNSTITKKNYNDMKTNFKKKGGMMKYQTGGKKSKVTIGGISTSTSPSKKKTKIKTKEELALEKARAAAKKAGKKVFMHNGKEYSTAQSKITIGGISVIPKKKRTGGFRDTFLEPGIESID